VGGFAPKGHARLNPLSPRAFAICDRCGFLFNHDALQWDMQYQGRFLQKTGFLVCNSCNDTPNPTLRPIILPADPVPILNPRAEPMHCHTFKPRADLDGPPFYSPATRHARADIKWDNYPPVDHFRDVTVDSGSVCDNRSPTWSNLKPDPGPSPFPPEPPLLVDDASADTTLATADATGTTADAYSPFIPLTGFFAVADTTQESADNVVNGTDSFPDYVEAADEDTRKADTTVVKSDDQRL